MFMYLQKNKKGFTLIELMVVVAIIGILALLGLRLYTGQQEKAKEAIVKANAGTVQTLIQAELADANITDPTSMLQAIDSDWDATNRDMAGMQNPFSGSTNVVCTNSETVAEGEVQVSYDTDHFVIQGYDGSSTPEAFGE